ncbi:MAG: FtsX-like permease family protein [Nitrososphaerota archaeon]|nr:FtsX-like permease family protein [Candidatus Bathyarchaeota archaeon]MDW8048269.1 FtsX-like permease family protein [Nitrososphaerota archaeon]
MITYATKRVSRSWNLFIALLLSVILASSFFAGINISIDLIGLKSLQQQLEQVYADVVVTPSTVPVFSPQNTTLLKYLLSNIDGVESVDVISRVNSVQAMPITLYMPDGSNMTLRFFVDSLVGISKGSRIYKDIVSEMSIEPEENEAFIESLSVIATRIKAGDTLKISIPIIVGSGSGARLHRIERSLKVIGFVNMDDSSYLMTLGVYTMPVLSLLQPSAVRRVTHNFIIIDWEKTLARILDEINSYTPSFSPIVTNVLINIDRNNLLNPWDIEVSKTNIDRVVSIITNTIRTNYGAVGLNVSNNIGNVFRIYEGFSTLMTLQGVILSLPVFFIAWYVGLTASSVSFNLRRREIGLLLAKGFTNRQLLKIFLMEAIIVGIIGAVAGLFLGEILSPIFSMNQFIDLLIIGPDTVLLVVFFSVAIAFLAVLQPAKKAANLKLVETLREYLSLEEPKSPRKIWIWLALSLGTYKIIMLLLGSSLDDLLSAASGILSIGRAGFLINLLLRIIRFIDSLLLYLGPILFFWGFTKIFVAQSLKFQKLLARVSSPIIKDLSLLAEKNIHRNAARIASATFLMAIILGYAVSTVGQIETQTDYTSRLIYQTIGSDINIIPDSIENISSIRNALLTNVPGIAAVAVEYRGFTGQTVLGADFSSTQLSAINPEEWLKAAYYEDEWFVGGPAEQIFKDLSNETIILEGRFSDYVKIGDIVSITIGNRAFNLKVIGFYGPSSAIISSLPQAQQLRLNLVLHSYISDSLFAQVKGSVSSTARILVKLQPGQDGETIAQKINELSGVEWVNTAAEQIRLRAENVLLSGSLNISRLGVLFATLAASIAITLVTSVTLLEKRKEITLLMVKGLSAKQVILMLIAENLGALLVASAIGTFVGYLVHRGNVASTRTVTGLVASRVVFSANALASLIGIYGLLTASVAIPIIIMVKIRASRLIWRT